MVKQRIAYIDFMKGLCILLVVAFHIEPNMFGYPLGHMLQQFRIPMYFFLSGLFFKLYDGFFDFARRKTNNIVVPLVFFLLLGILYVFSRNLLQNHMNVSAALSQMPINPVRTNTPMWFLVVLFEVNIVYYLLQKFLPRWLTIVAAIILSMIGYILVQCGYNLILYFDITLVAMPFFILGSESRRLGLLERGPHMAVRIALALVTIVILYFFAEKINMYERIYPSYFKLYMLPAVSILALLFLCQYIKRPVPVISHVGRYSIIVLGTQYQLIGPLKLVVAKFFPAIADSFWHYLIVLVIIVILEYPIIYLLRKYCPRLTAQEPFFYEGWKLKKEK